MVGGEAAYGSAPPGEGPVVVATSKPVTITNLAILEPVPAARVINTMIHEMGHRIVGLGHPNLGGTGTGLDGGVAPLIGTDRTRRLMASGGHRADDGYLLVKKEWDRAETWLADNVRP